MSLISDTVAPHVNNSCMICDTDCFCSNTGHEIHDHGDLGFDYVPEDDQEVEPLVKNSHSLGRALQKVINFESISAITWAVCEALWLACDDESLPPDL